MNQTSRKRPVRVDNNCLVAQSGVVLPPICIKTNKKVTKAEHVKRQIRWTKETRGRKLFMIASYFMSRQYCEVTYGLAAGQKLKYILYFWFKIALLVISILLMFMGAVLDWNQFVILAFVVIGLVIAILLPFGNHPLVIVREENGEFWLKGCCNQFLARAKPRPTSTG